MRAIAIIVILKSRISNRNAKKSFAARWRKKQRIFSRYTRTLRKRSRNQKKKKFESNFRIDIGDSLTKKNCKNTVKSHDENRSGAIPTKVCNGASKQTFRWIQRVPIKIRRETLMQWPRNCSAQLTPCQAAYKVTIGYKLLWFVCYGKEEPVTWNSRRMQLVLDGAGETN